ncbi:MAG TPA: UDP-2,3-diacylglucosamine diphosphatase [Gammaproteobacteria bacterium]|nr:UDP-2,3-diacylglucosamine diphosphatase [Gammaproteobacteria bacterium]
MNRPILFISDLHLDPRRPAITELFLRFLQEQRGQAQALYILGDLFEAWIGDDAVADDEPSLAVLRAFSLTTPTYFMHGNRDFLVGERFAALTGIELLPDPTVIDLFGRPTLLMHGDSLCTDDHDYQKFRQMVRNPAWQQGFLAMPIPQRIALAQQARSESGARNQSIDDYLMDVNQQTVEAEMRRHGVQQLIHGHTHRPAIHHFELDGRDHTRVVLGDWFEQGSVLRVTADELSLEGLPLPT